MEKMNSFTWWFRVLQFFPVMRGKIVLLIVCSLMVIDLCKFHVLATTPRRSNSPLNGSIYGKRNTGNGTKSLLYIGFCNSQEEGSINKTDLWPVFLFLHSLPDLIHRMSFDFLFKLSNYFPSLVITIYLFCFPYSNISLVQFLNR